MSRRMWCRREGPSGRTLAVRGSLTSGNARRLLAKMHNVAGPGGGPLTVDVSNVSYFDSVALTILLGTERILERQRGCAVDIRGLETATARLTGLEAR